MDRLFVAALPDVATAEALDRLPRPDERGVRWVPAENWHVTLRFLGACHRDEALDRLGRKKFARCHATLGPAVDWLGPHLVVPVIGVDELAAAVAGATADIGEPARGRFRGHLTIARTRRSATSTILGHPFEASFTVDELVLVRSELTTDASRYTVLATFPTR